MKTIWGFGTATIDIRIKTADYGEGYKDKLLSQEMSICGGGATANFLSQIARLGGNAGYIGKTGTDPFGEFALRSLSEEKINISAVIRDTEQISPFNLAVYAGDLKRRVGGYLLPNALTNITCKDISHFTSFMKSDDWLLIEVGEIPLTACLDLARKAKCKGVKIAIDVDLDPIKQCREKKEDIQELFNCCDILLPNKSSLKSLYPEYEIHEMLQALYDMYHVVVIITDGGNGSNVIEISGKILHFPCVKTLVVDTVGAGVAFHGGVIWAMAEGLSIRKAVELGTICGSHNCMTFGARGGMISSKELNQYKFEIEEL